MTITPADRRKIIKEYESKRMRRVGKVMTPKKRAAIIANLAKANAARLAKKPATA